MKKNIFATVLLSGLVLASGVVASAEPITTPTGEGSRETSKVEVKLTEDKGHEPGSGPFKDKLAIVHKPTVFKFSGTTTTGALNLSNEHPNKTQQFITVNDDRKASNGDFMKGAWKLEGQLSNLNDNPTDPSSGNNLPAKMIFSAGDLFGYNIGPLVNTNGVEDYAPAAVNTATTIPGADVTADKYKLTQSFTLEAGQGAIPFLTATDTADVPASATGDALVRGVGTNLGNVNLAIATGNAQTAGTYTGTITWTLSPGA